MNHAVHATEQAEIHRLRPDHVAIRHLWPVEKDRLFRHCKRLHPNDLRLRFGSAVLRAARNRGAERLHMICMRDNPRMIALARAHRAKSQVRRSRPMPSARNS